MEAKRRILWVVLVLLTVAWARYAALMREYPLTSPYPLTELSVRLFWFGLVVAALYTATAVLIVKYGAWTRAMFAAAGVIAVIAVTMAPTRSPDLYWSLDAGRAWVQEGLNPYAAELRVTGEGAWSARAGVVLGMTYGPLWTLMVSAAAVTGSLTTAIALMKFVGVAGLAALLVAVRELVERSGVSVGRREALMALVVLNPLLIHTALVDVVSEVLVVAAIAWAMVLTARGRYIAAAAVLALGGLVKYVPWFLIPVPLVLALNERKKLSRGELVVAAAAVIVVIAAYAPFGTAAVLGGAMRQSFSIFTRADMAFPFAWALLRSGMTVFWVQISGVLAALAAVAVCIAYRRWALAWWLPLALLLVVGGSWVNPWYLLWLLPAAAAAGNAVALAAIGIAGFLMPWVVKSRAMGFALLGGALWYWRNETAALVRRR